MMLYLIPATIVFSKACQAFWDDDTTPNTHLFSWMMILLASVLWPLTLPSMLYKQYLTSVEQMNGTNGTGWEARKSI